MINWSIKGFNNIEYLKELFEENKEKGGTLLIIDDQMQNIDYNLVNIFTIYSHHLKARDVEKINIIINALPTRSRVTPKPIKNLVRIDGSFTTLRPTFQIE